MGRFSLFSVKMKSSTDKNAISRFNVCSFRNWWNSITVTNPVLVFSSMIAVTLRTDKYNNVSLALYIIVFLRRRILYDQYNNSTSRFFCEVVVEAYILFFNPSVQEMIKYIILSH